MKKAEIEHDEYKRPPNLLKAKKHGIAKRFAAPMPFTDFDKGSVCPCCGYPYKNQILPLCVSISEFSFIGSGIVLYFDFVIYSQIILLIYMLQECTLFMIIVKGSDAILKTKRKLHHAKKISTISFQDLMCIKLDVVASYLNFATIILLIISTLIYRRHINKICLEIDDAEIEVSDYSIMIYNAPKNCKKEDIRSYFLQEEGMEELELRKICMAYEVKPFLQLKIELEENQAELSHVLDLERQKKKSSKSKAEILQKIKEIHEKLDYVEKYKEIIFRFTGVIFLSFNYEKHADQVCDQFQQTKFQLLLEQLNLKKYQNRKFLGNSVIVRKAPLPGDVLWENLGIEIKEQYKRIVTTNVVTAALLAIGFAMIFGLSYMQEFINAQVNYDPTTTAVIINFLGFLASLIISFINSVLSSTIIKLIIREQHSTKTEYDISIAKKIGLAEFINVAILTLLVNILIKGQNETTINTMYQKGGLNSDVMWIFMTDSFMPWFLFIFDFEHLKKLYIRRQIKQLGSTCKLTQKEANEAFEGPMINLAEKYPAIAKTLLMALFYAPLLPACSFFALASIMGIYWIEKILLLRRDSKPLPTGSDMAQAMVEFYIDLVILIYSLGNCVWEYTVFNTMHWSTWISFIICSIFYLLPKERVLEFILKIGIDNATEESYDAKSPTFLDDYDRRNPVTAEEAKRIWIENQQQQNSEMNQINQLMSAKQLDISIYRYHYNIMQQQSRQQILMTNHKSFSKVHPEFKTENNYNLKKLQY
ncbi:unnamed protein product [Paramecium octaurelia]|uniref:CSC1/OSCA1-like cytosolic domain-containing protein n=2 Tax=Paramecium octaurelia TaxID=43137 RepID=A0A8S1WGN5_PAROT|nr:unnamed protein product [Paramecium octaurelia]